ncbi:MAG: HAMP domain-containing histidine kinase [Symploca sp. SIO2B6]|nr:HAMP domain-containing histidine kinase [Symploca sp. SIO2B6]
MFDKIRYQLLFSYLAVLMLILGLFAINVRIIFVNVLDRQLKDRLKTLAQAAALDLELDGGEIEVDKEPLVSPNQAIQWFDTQGNLIDQQGEYVVNLPFNPKHEIQTQLTPYPARSLTSPVVEYDKKIFIGYTRVSESTVELNNTLQSLDLRLGVGVVVALALSAVGGIWLTRQAMKPIEQSFQRLQRFTSDASHELRSPLMAIKTNAAVALKYPDGIRDLDAEKFLAIKSASTQLTALTENLLMLARSDRGLLPQPEVIDLSTLLEELVRLYQPRFEEKEIDFKAQLQEELLIFGDQIQLTRLFTNLIDNALRYTLTGGTVEVRNESKGDRLSASVQDTGMGIAPEHIEHIFDRFWQVDRGRSYQLGGFGLGLALAQGIAQNHGGEITVTSELGRGSCFIVSLPAYQS